MSFIIAVAFFYSIGAVWPDWAIYWTLGNLIKPLEAINLPKSPTILGNFCKGVKINHFSCEVILGNFYRHSAIFFWSHWLLLMSVRKTLWWESSPFLYLWIYKHKIFWHKWPLIGHLRPFFGKPNYTIMTRRDHP